MPHLRMAGRAVTEPHRPQPDPLLRRVLAGLLLWLAVVCAITAPPHPNGLTLLSAILAIGGVWLLRPDLS